MALRIVPQWVQSGCDLVNSHSSLTVLKDILFYFFHHAWVFIETQDVDTWVVPVIPHI
jgi:hypothetical protein